MEAAKKAARLARSLAAASCPSVYGGVFIFFAAVVAGALLSACWMSASTRISWITPVATPATAQNATTSTTTPNPDAAPSLPRLTSVDTRTNQTPPATAYFAQPPREQPAPAPAPAPAEAAPDCPAYFRWIHEDLRPWRDTGITRDAVEEGARRYAPKFRVTVLSGRLYVARYGRCFQSRDVFTQWGILQLLRRYPGRVPDLDLMFECQDLPVVVGAGGRGQSLPPPPLFVYCGSETTLDITFPDWSFWGWPELNIKPWEALRQEIKEGNAMVDWKDRAPYAYWKGNPTVGAERRDLLRCNVSGKRDWNARIYAQDWRKEVHEGFRESDLSKQCTHRYKIYIEGRGWSVSEKYILACDSVALLVTPRFHDFFSRGLMPLRHYWPVGDRGKCRSIKFAVDWGNAHADKAQEIGGNASRFIQEELPMDRVYDYMFHLLTEYAKLLRYSPAVPRGAAEVTVESMMRGRRGLQRKFMMDTLVNDAPRSRGGGGPCRLQPPFSPQELDTLRRTKAHVISCSCRAAYPPQRPLPPAPRRRPRSTTGHSTRSSRGHRHHPNPLFPLPGPRLSPTPSPALPTTTPSRSPPKRRKPRRPSPAHSPLRPAPPPPLAPHRQLPPPPPLATRAPPTSASSTRTSVHGAPRGGSHGRCSTAPA